jgi:HSP20 family protein
MRRLTDDMDRMFSGFGFGRSLLSEPWGRLESLGWSPQVDAFQRGNEFVVRADLPGLDKDDVQIEVTDQALTIRGERRQEQEEEREGVWHSERTYGSFTRVIPLPEGALTETAKANFRNGVLEVAMQAPPREVSRSRRLEISEGEKSEKSK